MNQRGHPRYGGRGTSATPIRYNPPPNPIQQAVSSEYAPHYHSPSSSSSSSPLRFPSSSSSSSSSFGRPSFSSVEPLVTQIHKGDNYTLMVVSWNQSAMSFNARGTTAEQQEYNMSTVTGYVGGMVTSSAYKPTGDFAGEWASKLRIDILEVKPDIIFFASQESRGDDLLHTQYLPHTLETVSDQLRYKQLKTTSMMGIGASTMRGLAGGAIHTRGLQNSIYVRDVLHDEFAKLEGGARQVYGSEYQKFFSYDSARSKGAIASYMRFPTGLVLAFINANLPFDSQNLKDYKNSGDSFVRKKSLFNTDTCYIDMIRSLVYSTDNVTTQAPEYIPHIVILCGTLGYRVEVPDIKDYNWGTYVRDMYPAHDELKQEMRAGNVQAFREGVDRKGPQFYPTDRMKTTRNPGGTTLDNYDLGDEGERLPAWADRILYNTTKTYNDADAGIICTAYDRFDYPGMQKSTHAGVVASFKLNDGV